jgi:hypothetical protein
MPLPAANAERKLKHTRTVLVEGFERGDGLWDIDGWLTDIKTYSFPNRDRGEIKAGEPLHGMGLRLTIDEAMLIHDAVAVTDFAPVSICPNITPSFKQLIGMKIKPGFNNAVKEKLGGVKGCTHLVELLGPMATTAFQTLVARRFEKMASEIKKDPTRPPRLMDSCHSWAADGPIIAREFPQFYTGAAKAKAPAE